MILGPCSECYSENCLPHRSDSGSPICSDCYNKHYSIEAIRDKKINSILRDKWYKRIFNLGK